MNRIKDEHPNIYKTFFLNDDLKKEQADKRRHNESLHDYLTRKQIACFCKPCRYAQAQEAAKNQTVII